MVGIEVLRRDARFSNKRSTCAAKVRHSSVVRGLQVQIGFNGAPSAAWDVCVIDAGGVMSRSGNCKPLPVCMAGMGQRGMLWRVGVS